ncbi:MAG: hypothetical protein MUD01_26180 [Chloroflexaceae bacterium]|jgi:hypothetical protein|nr:hypothetical protein [Chloroflexaceae bacterium]
MQGCNRLLGRLFLLLFGLCFVALGVGLGVFGAQAASASAARAERLTPLSAGALGSGALGQEVLVEGVVDASNQPRFRNFVAYTMDEYQGRDNNDRQNWDERERVTPPLLIAVGNRTMQLANNNYRLEGNLVEWRNSESLTASTVFEEGTKRYQGLEPDATVMSIGTLVRGQNGLALQAEFIFAGNRAAYIASQQEGAFALRIVGLIFGIVGGILALAGLWVFVRR